MEMVDHPYLLDYVQDVEAHMTMLEGQVTALTREVNASEVEIRNLKDTTTSRNETEGQVSSSLLRPNRSLYITFDTTGRYNKDC